MKPLTFWFDVVSPYAWLAFDRLPQALEGCSHSVQYRPILFAGLLHVWGQKGPAEIGPKRAWTYRQVRWLAHCQGTRLDLPLPHPFNPLALQRLAIACAGALGTPNRRVVQALFEHVWHGGGDPNDPARLRELRTLLNPADDPEDPAIKQRLRDETGAAAAAGVFGVPTFGLDDRLFWGADALGMLRAAILGDAWFDGPDWEACANQPAGIERRQSTR
jgi:2-hydroxychromene-2-carboxylate isomerase